MKRNLIFNLLAAGILLIPTYGFAQRTCASNEVMLEQMEKNSRFAEKMLKIEAYTKSTLNNANFKVAGVITIPVHVIVVYSNSSQNISDAQIQSQIDVLNLDYRKLNSDWTLTPGEFYSLVSDVEIEFTLQGIERHSNSRTQWGTNDLVKSTYPPYSPNTTLNIWVCNIGGGILGYAQFPGGDPSTDGVVIGPEYLGSSDYDDGSFYLSAPFDKGRTATHEIGHWLNLRHIWGDGPCGYTDYVDDTPDAEAANYGCPTHPHNTCSSDDMFMNYMDYVDDACMYMFSEGQKSRIRAIFEPGGPRESFVNGGTITCSVDACDGNVSLELVLDNYPSETSWMLTDEGGTVIDQGSGYSSSGSTITKNWNLSEGQYTFTIYDSYGDGICCSYGNGSYELTDGCTNVLKSGGAFGSSESITFCVPASGSTNTSPVAEANGPYTSTVGVAVSFSSSGSTDPDGSITGYLWDFGDGSTSTLANPSHAYASAGDYTVSLTVTDNGGATDIDYADVTISGSGGETILTFDDFEGGWGNWTDGGGDCSYYSGGSRAYSGSHAIDIQDNSGVASSFYLTNPVDVNSPGYSVITVEFYFYAYSMESGEDFFVQYFNGSSWQTVASFVRGVDFNNSTFYVATVQILEANYTFPSNMKIRFMCDASSNSDDVYIDDITISASSGTARITGSKTVKALNTLRSQEPEDFSENVEIFPNPATNEVTIQAHIDDYSVARLYSYNGALLQTINLENEETVLDISHLASGVYFIKVAVDDEIIVHKLIKK